MVAAACPAVPGAQGRCPDPALCDLAGLPDIVLSALVPEQIWALTPQAIAAVPAPKFAVSSWHRPLAHSAGARVGLSPCMQGKGDSWLGQGGGTPPRKPDIEAWRWDVSWLH